MNLTPSRLGSSSSSNPSLPLRTRPEEIKDRPSSASVTQIPFANLNLGPSSAPSSTEAIGGPVREVLPVQDKLVVAVRVFCFSLF